MSYGFCLPPTRIPLPDRQMAGRRGAPRRHMVKMLLAAGVSANEDKDRALQAAAKYGRDEVVRIVLKAEARANANNSFALFHALTRGHDSIAKMLLKERGQVSRGDLRFRKPFCPSEFQ